MLRLICVLFLLPVWFRPAAAQGETAFADNLFGQGDYYNAQTEYLRYAHQHPQAQDIFKIRMRIALIDLYRDNGYGAVRKMSTLLSSGLPEAEELAVRQTLARLYTRLGHYNIAHMHLEEAARINPAGAAWYRTWTWLSMDRADKALVCLEDSGPGMKQKQLAAAIREMETLPRKSPGLAKWMSFFIPGSGQIYCGRPIQGIGSLLINGGFAAWFTHRMLRERYAEAAAIYLFGWARFHVGGMNNARRDAEKYNRTVRKNAVARLAEKFGISLTPETEKNIYCLE